MITIEHAQSISNLRPVDRVLLLEMRGGKTRQLILSVVLKDFKTCENIARTIGINWKSTSWHLGKLKEAGLIYETRIGRITFYHTTSAGERAVEALQGPPCKV